MSGSDKSNGARLRARLSDLSRATDNHRLRRFYGVGGGETTIRCQRRRRRQQNVGGDRRRNWNVQPLYPVLRRDEKIIRSRFFLYSISCTRFEIFNHNYDDTVNIP